MSRYLLLFLAILLISSLISAPSHARKQANSGKGQNCEMVETINLGANFSNVPIQLKDIKSHMDAYVEKVRAAGKEQGLEEMTLQNLNYNVYGNNQQSCGAQFTDAVYRLNGNVSFVLDDQEKAIALIEKLSEESLNVNFNVSSYRKCQ